MSPNNKLKAAQDAIWAKWADTLKKDPSPENYAKAYDEINAFLRDQGDPGRSRAADGTIYGDTGDENDWQKRIIALLAGAPGNRVLETGCGDGRMSMSIAQRGATVKGIDISVVAIDAANKLAAARKLTNVTFKAGNAIVLDEPSSTYDYVVSSDMVEHLNPEQVTKHFQEVHRVLKPKGVYIVSLPGWEPADRVDPLHLGNYHPPEFMALLRKGGFEPTLAPEALYLRTGDLAPILGTPKTAKAKVSRAVTKFPGVGRSVGCKLIHRWCDKLNFFYAERRS